MITRLTIIFDRDEYETCFVDELREVQRTFNDHCNGEHNPVAANWERIFSIGGMPAHRDLPAKALPAYQAARSEAGRTKKPVCALYCDY